MASFCTKCGNTIPDGVLFCTQCGQKATDAAEGNAVKPAVITPPPVSKPNNRFTPPPDTTGRYSVARTSWFFWTMLLYSIPVVGWVFAIVAAFGSSNSFNKRNFARAYLIWLIVGIILSAILILLVWAFFSMLAPYFYDLGWIDMLY